MKFCVVGEQDLLIAVDSKQMLVWNWRNQSVMQVHELAWSEPDMYCSLSFSHQLCFMVLGTQQLYECAVWQVSP